MGYLNKYYLFGDVVYKMARRNFYITWEGMIASDMPVRHEHFHDKPINENEILHLKNWKWLDSRNRYILPKGFNLETYPDMRNSIKYEYANRKIDEIVQSLSKEGTFKVTNMKIFEDDVVFTLEGPSGSKRFRNFRESLYPGNVLNLMGHFMNGEHINIKQNQMHLLEGSTVLAIALAEPIRNFRTFSINEMMMNINAREPISLHTLIECNPMTRGKSWGYLGNTGLTVNKINHKQIVLPRELNIARTFLLTQKGEDGQNNKYRFLTDSEYNQLRKEMPPEELARITFPITENEMHNTIIDYKPENTDRIVRTKPLGDHSFPTVNDVEVFTEKSMSKAMPIRASVAMVNDYIHVINHVSKVIAQKSQVTGKDLEIIQSTIEFENGNVKLFVRDKSNPTDKIELNIEINENILETNGIKKETSKEIDHVQEMKSFPPKSLTKLNDFLGVYGIVMGFRGAVQDFEEGKIGEGIVNIAQSVHGIYGMSQSAQRVLRRITSKIFSAGLQKIEAGLAEVSTRIRTFFSRGELAVSETLSAAGRVAGDIPVIGTAFGIYNTVQDIRRKTTIGYIDAGLDAAITISALFGPEALIVTVALTIVRLVIDDFYYAISNELKNLPSDASALQKVGAVLKGIGEGIVMTIKAFYDFTSLGLLSFAETYINIDKRYNEEHALFHKMSDYHNYLRFVKEGKHEKVINFAAGDASWNGGNIIFQMFDDNTARLRMQIVDGNGREHNLDKFIALEKDSNDIFLGIGESHDISFKKESAKLFWVIPVHSQYLIDKIRGDQNTLHGTYYGNSKDNKFFTVQNLTKDTNLGYSLADYYYEIYGEDGDDTFYCGPQQSIVKGGNGRDTYIIPYSGGKTTINNYATDLEEDVLFIDVHFEQIHADRRRNDLILKHGHEHDITVLNWFSGHRMGHLTFKAKDGVIFNVTIGVYGRAFIVPLAIVLTGTTTGHDIDVSRGLWEHVKMVIGSEASDRIVGNKNDNLLNGGKGNNSLYGEAGSDTYLISSAATSAWNVINNFDTKLTVDKVIFEYSYEEIIVSKNDNHVRMETVRNGPTVIMNNWFTNEYYRHCVFVTKDDIIFKLSDDINEPNIRQPIILDASKETTSVVLNAKKRGFENVTTIIGSNFDDVILGSSGNNYLKGGRGSDKITGGEGRDVYVIHKEDIGDFIDNFAEDGKDDLLLIDFNFNHITVNSLNLDVVLKVKNNRIVTIQNWIKGENWRHIVIRTIDGISFRLEKSAENIILKSPLEIDKSAMTTKQIVNTNKNRMRTVEHIIGSNATDTLVGNEHANRIDPGFGGAYMMGIDGHDIYVIKDHYKGPNIINNFARDDLTDTIKLPTFFDDVYTNISENDILLESVSNPSASVTLQKYKMDPGSRHLVINTIQDGVVFTIPQELDFQPTAISIDRTNQAHNLIIDLESKDLWKEVVTVLGSKEHSNVIKGNEKNNTFTGGTLSDTLEGGDGNDVIRGNQGDDFIDGGNGM
jgi:Ca2+-binding RTX toxin-like protein